MKGYQRNNPNQMISQDSSPAKNRFYALTEVKQEKIKAYILKIIKEHRRIVAYDLDNAIRGSFWDQPDYDWSWITKHSLAAVWILEEEGEIERTRNDFGRQVLTLVEF